MQLLLLNLFLALIWGALQGEFSPAAFLQGFVLGYIILWTARRALNSDAYFRTVGALLRLLGYFIRELIVANLQLARKVLTPGLADIRPGFVAVPIDLRSNAAITLLANMLSLTPGTLAVDVSSDHRTLYLHVLDAGDVAGLVQVVKGGFERRVREVLGS